MANTMNQSKTKNEERLNQPGQGTVDRAKDAAAAVADKAKETASNVMHSAENAASYVGHRAEDATSAVGGGLKSLGSTIREHAPNSGMIGDASAGVAKTLESAGRYLQEEGLKGVADDVTNLIRRNPIPALLVAVGVGFLLARATTSRS